MAEHFDTVVIGGGQTGLAVGYYLGRQGRSFVILDAGEHVGDAWRSRWDSLRLFTPARYDGLPGMSFPAKGWSFPTKDEMADYLAAYAARFDLPVRTGVQVDGLSREGDRYVVTAGGRRFEADNVVIATGAMSTPKAPEFATALDPGVVQFHSSAYRRPSQLQDGDVLLVGLGNSGAEIAFELARTRRVWLAGAPTGQIPVRHGSFPARIFLPVFRFLGHRVLTRGTPIGRKAAPKLVSHGTPLIRVKEADLRAAGVERVPRVVGVRDGRPLLEDGRTLDVANVIWCTGFHQDFSWIDLPVFAQDGQPLQERGVVTSEPGLYFVGSLFLYAVTSDTLPGVARDARHVAKRLAQRAAAREAEAKSAPDAVAEAAG